MAGERDGSRILAIGACMRRESADLQEKDGNWLLISDNLLLMPISNSLQMLS